MKKMKNVMKKWKKTCISLMLVLTFLLLVGCGRKNETVTSEIVTESVSQTITIEEPILEKAPEGYVYDYQVSMEPIPEDVAAFGGEVCGTIHAFPTKIKVEMMRRELEKPENAELKNEADRCAEEIVEALEKEYGGEFTAELMEIKNDFWYFKCENIENKNAFRVRYENYGFSDVNKIAENYFDIDTYLFESNVEDVREKITDKINMIYENTSTKMFKQYLGSDLEFTNIYLAVFKENFNVYEEQEKIMELWDELIEINNENNFYSIRIDFFPLDYQNVIEEKCSMGSYLDVEVNVKEEKKEKWVKNEEAFAIFTFHQHSEGDLRDNIDVEKSIFSNWKLKEE